MTSQDNTQREKMFFIDEIFLALTTVFSPSENNSDIKRDLVFAVIQKEGRYEEVFSKNLLVTAADINKERTNFCVKTIVPLKIYVQEAQKYIDYGELFKIVALENAKLQ